MESTKEACKMLRWYVTRLLLMLRKKEQMLVSHSHTYNSPETVALEKIIFHLGMNLFVVCREAEYCRSQKAI